MVLRHMLPQTPSDGLLEYQEPIHTKFDHPQLRKKRLILWVGQHRKVDFTLVQESRPKSPSVLEINNADDLHTYIIIHVSNLI